MVMKSQVLILVSTIFCFISYSCSQQRIFNGHDVTKGEAPYTVVLLSLSKSLHCTGSIISDRFILTAAHCVSRTWKIIAGITSFDNHQHLQYRRVIKRKVHKRYKSIYTPFDIGMLLMDKPLFFNNMVNAISLPQSIKNLPEYGTIYGWGMINRYQEYPATLQTAKVPIIDYKNCNILDHIYFNQDLNQYSLCSGRSNATNIDIVPVATGGDSGGPLVKKLSSNDELIGIISMSDYEETTIFVNVVKFIDWINNEKISMLK